MRKRRRLRWPLAGFAAAALVAVIVIGSAAAGTIRGTPRNDTLRGTPRADKLYGNAGNDRARRPRTTSSRVTSGFTK